jgi:hypothetical protein
MADDTVDGELSLSAGWWVRVPQEYGLAYEEDGSVVLQRSVILVRPQVVSFDASRLTEPEAAIAAGIVSDTVDGSAGRLQDHGAVSGEGWQGGWCDGVLDPERDEYELIAALAAKGTILNLAITYLGSHTGDEARWILDRVVHRPETAEFTDKAAAVGVQLHTPIQPPVRPQ